MVAQHKGRGDKTQGFVSQVVPSKGMKEMKSRMFRFLLLFILIVFVGFSNPSLTLAADDGAPVISGSPLVLALGDSYDPLVGIRITDDLDSEGTLLAALEVRDYVDTGTPGEYEILYFVTDSDGNQGILFRLVAVLGPELPVIIGGNFEVEKNAVYDPMENVFAFDLSDGDLSTTIRVLHNDVDTAFPGEYFVTYEVTDSDLNRVEKTIPVYVFWPAEYFPVIQVTNRMIQIGDVYDPLFGVTATDITDGDLTGRIEVQYTSVDTSTPGVYYTEYMVINSLDLMGNASSRVVVFDLSTSPAIVTEPLYLETGWIFDPLTGVYAYDLEDGDITHKIEVIENTVDTSRAGEYYVKYRVEDSEGNAGEATAVVLVEWSWDWMPQIQVDPYLVYLPLNGTFDPMEGVLATDRSDGDITNQVEVFSQVDTSVPGVYYVDYSVTNSLGIPNGAWRQVIVFESSVPVIWAENFESPLDQELDPMWMKLEAYDLEDGDLRESISWDVSAVNIHVAGTYPIVVSVTDSDGNTAQTTIYVTIKDYSYPELYVEDYTVYLNAEFDPFVYVGAWDSLDGEITNLVVVTENTVKIKKEGIYTVTYSVTNSLGKTTTKTVNVEVTIEPVIEYFIIYDGNLFLMKSDETGTMAFITPNMEIPQGAELGIAVYADGESVMEFYGFTMSNDLLPGFTYSLEVLDDQMITGSMLPYLFDGQSIRFTAKEAQIDFQSTVEGTFFYAVAEIGEDMPQIDTSGEGIPAIAGANTFRVGDLKPGVKPQVIYIVLKGIDGEWTNTLAVNLPTVPNPPSQGKKPEDPGKPEKLSPEVPTQELDGDQPITAGGLVDEDLSNEEWIIEGSEEELKEEIKIEQKEEPMDNGKPEKKIEDAITEEILETSEVVTESEFAQEPVCEKEAKKDKIAQESEEYILDRGNNGKQDQK